ncbi:DUF2225 domain-containing protein [Christensenellaceae bacterium OttesenSCG-928-K19]|nr:DUF2225 domain-containing protein [Christensenellaceae bacterium OttesenSCG-928-K19]
MIDIRLLQDASHQRSYKPGQPIVPADTNTREFFILLSGRVESTKNESGQEHTTILEPGDSFGERFFFTGKSNLVYRAKADAVIYAINAQTFLQLVSAHPQIAHELLQTAYTGGRKTSSPDVHECTPETYNTENALKAREAFREKFKGKIATPTAAEAPAASQATVPAATSGYPKEFFPEGYKGYAGITKPEYAKYLYSSEYKCPNCGQTFTAPKVFVSKLIPVGGPRYDLRKIYKDFSMEWYELLTCSHCYFSMYEEYFTTPKGLFKQHVSQSLQNAHSAIALDFGKERDLDFVFTAHFIALKCVAGYAGARHINMRLYSSLSWLFEDAGDEALMRDYAKKSAQISASIYEDSQLTPVQEQMMLLSTAGMLYRADEWESVGKLLLNVKTIKNGKKTYVDLADGLMDELRSSKQKK